MSSEPPSHALNARRNLEVIKVEDAGVVSLPNNNKQTKKVLQPGTFAKPSWKLLDGPPRRDANAAKSFYTWATSNSFDDSR